MIVESGVLSTLNFLIDVRVRVSRNKASFYLDSFIIIHASYGSYSEYCRDLTHTHKATLLSGGLLRTGAIWRAARYRQRHSLSAPLPRRAHADLLLLSFPVHIYETPPRDPTAEAATPEQSATLHAAWNARERRVHENPYSIR